MVSDQQELALKVPEPHAGAALHDHDVMTLAGIGVAQGRRERACLPLRFLQQHDVGVGGADGVEDPSDIHLLAAEPDIERHDPQLNRIIGSLGRRRRGQRRQQRQ